MIRKLIYVICRRAPPFSFLLVCLQVVLVADEPCNPYLWLCLWHQVGFAVTMGLCSRDSVPGSPLYVAYWLFREAMCWPHLFYRFCKD